MSDFDYFHHKSQVKSDFFKFLWEFNQATGQPFVADTANDAGMHSGIINDSAGFFNVSGKGFFDGDNYVTVANSTGLNFESFTLILDAQCQRGVAEVFATTQLDTGDYKGFTLGKTDSNYIYFQTNSTGGEPYTHVFDNIHMANDNIFALRKAGNNVTLSYYDLISDSIKSESIVAPFDVDYSCENFYFGGSPDFNHSQPDFSGYLKQVAFYEAATNDASLNYLFQGFKKYSSLPTTGQILLNEASKIQSNRASQNITGITGSPHYHVVTGWSAHLKSIFEDMGGNSARYIYTGLYNGSTFNMSGEFQLLSGDIITGSSILNTGVADASPATGRFTGVTEYYSPYLQTYYNNVFYYIPTAPSLPQFDLTYEYTSSYKTGYVGSPIVDRDAYPDYAIGGVANIEDRDLGGQQIIYLSENTGNYIPIDRNLIGNVNILDRSITITGGTGILLYEDGVYLDPTSYYFEGNKVFKQAGDFDLAKEYIYDYRDSLYAFTGATTDKSFILFDEWVGGFKAATSNFTTQTHRQKLYVDAVEICSNDQLYQKENIIGTNADTAYFAPVAVYTGDLNYWNYGN